MSLLLIFLTIFQYSECYPASQATQAYWMQQAQAQLQTSLLKQLQLNRAKNVILFIGDGMGIAPVTASRIYTGQTENLTSEQNPLAWENFPFAGLVKTYDADYHVTESASAATALMCGTKATFGTVGLGPEVKRSDCPSSLLHPAQSIMSWAIQAGKWGGLVTTKSVTDATPAATYAHAGLMQKSRDKPETNL